MARGIVHRLHMVIFQTCGPDKNGGSAGDRCTEIGKQRLWGGKIDQDITHIGQSPHITALINTARHGQSGVVCCHDKGLPHAPSASDDTDTCHDLPFTYVPCFMAGMTDIRNIVILTGAGISAESGIDTFRASGGLWAKHRVEDVATPEAFLRDPDLVLRFYDMRRENIQKAQPNAAHWALAHLDAEWKGDLLIVTQNVDDLHERAGARRLLHMHGEHLKALCTSCEVRSPWRNTLIDRPACPVCASPTLRPDIVWFGEIPYHMAEIDRALAKADLFVSIGTSGAVYPAAGFVQTARHYGAQTLELNLDPSQGSIFFDESRMGKAGDLVPTWVDEVLA
jgi:NAD-dependent deacetylase